MTISHRLLGQALKPTLTLMSRNRLPQVDGRIFLRALSANVTIHRDKWNIPHIRAATRHDLFLAQGFVHAQERLWQMELSRRAAAGTLAAVVGAPGLPTDRLSRTLGFARLAKQSWMQTSERVRADVEAYTAGVNAFLEGQPPLPVEFTLLGYRPELWQPLDTVAFGRMQAWALSHGWGSELARAEVIEKLGPEVAAELEPQYNHIGGITLPQGIELNQLSQIELAHVAVGPFLGKGLFEGSGRGSNAWAIAPWRSATGHAILCNDPHLPLTCPAIWFYLHLRCDGERPGEKLHVCGVSLPGAPYVMIGHNERIAWGATLTFIDCEDLFVERLHPDSSNGQPLYEFQGEWRPAALHEERIAVKGRPDHVERVIETHHGPILNNPFTGGLLHAGQQALVLASTALRPYETFDGFALLNEAACWDDFVAAVGRLEAPALNLVYADVDGNIGYYVSGRVPLRANGRGLVPAPGWIGDHEWIGDVPFAEMPHCLNPARGYVITANNRIVGDDYPHYLGALWRNGYRAERLEQLIESQPHCSLEDCRRFHLDFHSIPGGELVGRLANLETADPDAALCLELLRQWDSWLGADSVGGAVYQVFLARLTRALLEPQLGPELMVKFLGRGYHPLLHPVTEFYGHWTVTLLRLLDNPDSRWFGGESGRRTTLVRCLAETAAELRQRLGHDPKGWQWGSLHRARFNHALGARPPLDVVFNQGPVPVGGDTDTVNQTAVLPQEPYNNNAVSVSYRQIIDLGNLSQSQAMFAPGQSGHLGSPHYGDLIEPWLKGETFTMTWTAEEVAAATHHTLILTSAI